MTDQQLDDADVATPGSNVECSVPSANNSESRADISSPLEQEVRSLRVAVDASLSKGLMNLCFSGRRLRETVVIEKSLDQI